MCKPMAVNYCIKGHYKRFGFAFVLEIFKLSKVNRIIECIIENYLGKRKENVG